MRITKGDKTIIIPNWAIVIGALVADNIVSNICSTVINVNSSKKTKEGPA